MRIKRTKNLFPGEPCRNHIEVGDREFLGKDQWTLRTWGHVLGPKSPRVPFVSCHDGLSFGDIPFENRMISFVEKLGWIEPSVAGHGRNAHSDFAHHQRLLGRAVLEPSRGSITFRAKHDAATARMAEPGNRDPILSPISEYSNHLDIARFQPGHFRGPAFIGRRLDLL